MHPNIEELAKETMVRDIEAGHRLEGYRAGRVQGIPADEVFRRAIFELS